MKQITILFIFITTYLNSFAQNNLDADVKEYIEKYKFIAITEQIRTGIPAAIKLAQGIHETNAGKSELCTNANNHFGIKCKNTWEGQTYTYTDDVKNECFRKYNSDIESYHDHSDFLKNNKRYEPLFALDVTDYKAWAQQLKSSGYATNPKYAQRLVETIERYDLHQYTLSAQNRHYPKQEQVAIKQEVKEPVVIEDKKKEEVIANTTKQPQSGENVVTERHYSFGNKNETKKSTAAQRAYSSDPPAAYYVLTELNGLKGFYARKGDVLLEYAIKNKIRYAKLLEINDLKDEVLTHNMFIYTEKKHKKGLTETYTVQSGETLSLISQKTGVSLGTIRQLNRISEGFEPLPGEILNLQEPRSLVPHVVSVSELKTNNPAQNITTHKNNNEEEYIHINNAPTTIPGEIETKAQEQVKNTTDEIAKTKQNIATSVATQTEKVNIANEPAIEEIMENERKTQEMVATKEEPIEEPEDENLSPFEKLKRHMDKTVEKSGSQQSNIKTTAHHTTSNDDDEVTTPARQNKSITTIQSSNNTSNKNTTSKAKTHKVQKGDTLFKIAEKYNITVNQLKKWNGINSNNIPVGKVLKVSA